MPNTPPSIRQYAPGRAIPIMLDEYNLDGNWNDAETRQYTNIGAVYFATTIKHDAYAGMYACAIWSAKEGTYGITDMDDHLRVPAYLFQWANHNLIGSLVKTASTTRWWRPWPCSRTGRRPSWSSTKPRGRRQSPST